MLTWCYRLRMAALQRHYITLETVALDEDEENLPEIDDKTIPNAELLERLVFDLSVHN